MQTFKQFLKESQINSFDELVEELKLKCNPFFSLNIKDPIYRGVPSHYLHDLPLFVKHPESRSPRDSSLGFNFMFNAGIELALGIPDVRKTSVFVTPESIDAAAYGELCFFIPKGEFRFIWSKFVSDSYVEESGFVEAIAEKLSDYDEIKSMNRSTLLELINYIFLVLQKTSKSSQWIKNGESKTIIAVEEAMDRYKVELKTEWFHEKLITALQESFTTFYKDAGEENLSEAASRKNEILFYQTEGFFAVPVSFVRDAMEAEGIIAKSQSRKIWFEFLSRRISEHGKTPQKHK